MRYRTIVCDPPWAYDGFATMPGAPGTERATKVGPLPYRSMTLAEMRLIPFFGLVEPDCRLFCWATNRYLPEAFALLPFWGFTYRQTIVWHKTGSPSPFGGSVAPNHAEYLLVATIGKPAVTGRLRSSVIAAPKPYSHSTKPECFLDHVEACSPGPYLELFARRNRIGWSTWGNEALEHVDLSTEANSSADPDPYREAAACPGTSSTIKTPPPPAASSRSSAGEAHSRSS